MNNQLQFIIDTVTNLQQLSEAEKNIVVQAAKEVDKASLVLDFRLNRALKENRTVSILLEETIDELQRKSLVLEEAHSNLTKAYEELKATQKQLIHAEKMASLGELTAGIAHEIQNPLNFINNFSDINTELVEELQNELKAGNTKEALVLANDLRKNEQKIAYHGKRADAIVKGMLEHSRTSKGEKKPTDINTLAEEYLRLAFHGLRAKDKEFNASFTTSFDKDIGKIAVVPQDIGRVLLNLYNNAFYAVKTSNAQKKEHYQPTCSVSTKRENGAVFILVKDNGTGIPNNVLDKIFQPFFTTKPTGQGTGLGLSLSYDIIKAHGGEIKVESKEGEGTTFSVILPVEKN